MLTRSLFFSLLLAAGANVNASTDDTLAWEFKVYLNDKPIGYHDFRVRQDGDAQTVDIRANFDVNVLFVNLYRYRHQNVETWQNNCLTGIEAETDANGEDFSVSGTLAEEGFAVDTGNEPLTLPDCVMSFAYWNPAFLEADRLLNSQTGEYEPVTITREIAERININGETVPAVRYRVVASTGPITLWYHEDNYRWLALESPAAGGRTLRYEAISLPTGAPQFAER